MRRLLTMVTVPMISLCLMGCQSTTVRGPHGQSMTVVQPGHVSIDRGEAEEVVVTVERENFSGPVNVDVSNLPEGVEAIGELKGEVSGRTISFVLRATPDAALVSNHAAVVTIKGPDGMGATEHLRITVRQ